MIKLRSAKGKFLSLAMGLSMFGLVGMAQASIIDNGDFQTGDFTSWDHANSNVSVTTGPGGNSIANFDVSGGNGDARLYQNFMVDQSWGWIDIAFDFKLSTGTASTADFFKSFVRLETDSGATPDDVTVIIKENDPTSGWQHVEAAISFAGLNIDVTDPNARLTFVLKENIGDWSWARLDNVTVEAPEPGPMLLLATGLLGLVSVRMRKKSAV